MSMTEDFVIGPKSLNRLIGAAVVYQGDHAHVLGTAYLENGQIVFKADHNRRILITEVTYDQAEFFARGLINADVGVWSYYCMTPDIKTAEWYSKLNLSSHFDKMKPVGKFERG